jgi:glycosyltransferase involved in cell wall biosynthesis
LIGGKIPLIASIHSSHFIEFSEPTVKPLKHQLVKDDLGAALNLLFVSQYVRRQYEDLFPGSLEGKKVWIVHNPIDGSLFSPIPREEARKFVRRNMNDPLLLFVGNLIPRKATHFLIDAFSEVRKQHPEARLMIVGDGPERMRLERMIHEKDLGDVVSLEGAKSQAELMYYYNAADLFILPSLMESFGLVFIEAMLCGCPVLGTPEALKEVLPSDESGFYIPPGEIRELVRGIQRALERSWDREKIRRSVVHFDWKESIHRFEQIYCEICVPSPGEGLP